MKSVAQVAVSHDCDQVEVLELNETFGLEGLRLAANDEVRAPGLPGQTRAVLAQYCEANEKKSEA